MPTTTRTTGPLHFEDLDPHRFEDMVRRLIYDFRPWKELQATGRAGGDEGFDARGLEQAQSSESSESDQDDSTEGGPVDPAERIWLIQCKREKALGPAKLVSYLDEITPEVGRDLYGIIFAAACDFSKAARDRFREQTRQKGVSEAYLWGRGELEDMLYQPKNDDVLFTFFGISLAMRRRSLVTDVRRRLAIKRKANSVFAYHHAEVLIRDASEDRYPYARECDEERDPRRWRVFQLKGSRHDGIHLCKARQVAFVGDDGRTWDFAELMNDATPHHDPWRTDHEQQERWEARNAEFDVWEGLPERNKAWYEAYCILPYDRIIAIDEQGDEIFRHPHIYVHPFDGKIGPFSDRCPHRLDLVRREDIGRVKPDSKERVKKFRRKEDVIAAAKKLTVGTFIEIQHDVGRMSVDGGEPYQPDYRWRSAEIIEIIPSSLIGLVRVRYSDDGSEGLESLTRIWRACAN